MSRESILDKVRKLRALSTSSNLHEAATAAHLAEKLIQQHALEEAELELSQGSLEAASEDMESLVDWNKRQIVWENILLTSLARAYNCAGVLRRSNGKLGYFIIGRPADVATLKYQFCFFSLELLRLVERMAPALGRGEAKHWRNSFMLGGVSAIGESLRSARQEVRAQASSNALMVIDNHLKESLTLKHTLYPNSRTSQVKSNLDHDAYQQGRRAGSSLQSNPGLNAGVRGLLGR